jgi:hypothetical protein
MKKETVREPEKPLVNPPMPEELIKKLAGYFAGIKNLPHNHSERLNAPARPRLNGFIARAYQYAQAGLIIRRRGRLALRS